ncbi:MAG: hypothetical protein K2L15_03835 [Eubacteriales bacterium]|nr:hypothetical protein [Eubacteriales bacterium]
MKVIIFELITSIGIIFSIAFSIIAFSNARKKELKKLGASEKNVLNISKEIEDLKNKNEELEEKLTKEINVLNKKLETEVKDLKKSIDKNSENTHNNFMNITKILATLQAKMEMIEKKL